MTDVKKVKHPMHELLAVLSDLEVTAKKIREEAVTTFTKKANHFYGHVKTLDMYDNGREKEQEGAKESRALVTTVGKKLRYIQKSQAAYYDAVFQQEATNQAAVADLIINGEVFAENLPATFLLGMESRLRALRTVFDAIPTLDPTIEWETDPEAGEGIYKSTTPETSYKQEKTMQYKVMVAPTEYHPAQIREWADNRNVGTFVLKRNSSCISPAQKSQYLERLDVLLRAVKKARMRANSTEIDRRNIGDKLFKFILKG